MSAEPKDATKLRSTSAKEIFLAAAELAPAERAAYLDTACPGDADLRRRVEALLRAHDEPGSFPAELPDKVAAALGVKPSKGDELGETRATLSGDESVGAQVGPYKLLQRLGEGGMGTVYMAEQAQPVRRMVALKIVRTGMDSRQVIARFEAERQALALMDHPNIAKVLDAGTTGSGQPFFAMELVKGIPITRFCDEHHYSPRQRLELFIPVCHAVQHAHQKGIIHRDLKPSNVLVALYDDRPVPKVIDFGVAKATSQKLTDRTMFTEFGSVVGTLEYMSPEQAKLNALDVDTRSDIYALGVLLYELLTGTTPLERRRLKESALDEVLRVIREEEPPVPSTRLSQSKDSLPTVAAQRQTEPTRLAKVVRGELDWIVMKALEKDRSRRYETASGLARDIDRYLNQQPVEACPPSLGYRLTKLFRRNRGAVFAAALLLLALLGGIAGTSLGLVAANNALNAEEQQRKIAEEERDAKERARSAAATERDQKEQARAAAEQALSVNRINLAEQYWQGNNVVQSRRILDLCPPSARGWEWRYLDRLHHANLLTLAGNGQFTTDLQFNNDGKRMAAISPYGPAGARIWDLETNKPIVEISQSTSPARRFCAAALSADGRTIAMGEESGAISLWDATTGQLEREFAQLKGSVSTLSLSPDGRLLAAAHVDPRNGEMFIPWLEEPRNEELVVWNVASGKDVFHPKGYGYVAQFSPDGSRLFTLKKNTALRAVATAPESFSALFDTATWQEVAPGKLGSSVSADFSGDGKFLAIADFDRSPANRTVHIYNAVTGAATATLSPAVTSVNFSVALNQTGTTLAITHGLGFSEIEIWDVAKRKPVRVLRGHHDWVNAINFAPNGRLASCSRDGTIKFWDAGADQETRLLVKPSVGRANVTVFGAKGSVLAFSEYGAVSLFAGGTHSITLLNLEPGRMPRQAGGVLPALGRVFADTGAKMVESQFMFGVPGAIQNDRLDPTSGVFIQSFEGNLLGTTALGVDSAGKRIVCGGQFGDMLIADASTHNQLPIPSREGGMVAAVAISADGRWVASSLEPEAITAAKFGKAPFPAKPIPVAVKTWEVETAKQRLSPSGLVGGISPSALTAQERFTLAGHPGGVQQLAFDPTGKLLASAGDGTIKIWDLSTGRPLKDLNDKEVKPTTSDALAFSSSGKLLVTAGIQTAQIWDVDSGHFVCACQGHQAGKLSVAMSPDESRLATAAGRQVKLWDARTGQEALTLPLRQLLPEEQAAGVVALAWTADGQRLRAALSDGSVIEWDATPKPQ
jgi:serine/threonine protein kinase/WD40 repeat protein